MCRKTKGGTQPLPPNDNQPAAYSKAPQHNQNAGKKWPKRKHKSQNEIEIYEEEGEQYSQTFCSIAVSDVVLNVVREEAFTSLQVQHINPPVDGNLKLKVDTGAAGNTLSSRIYHQIFGNTPMEKLLTPESSTHLTSYSSYHLPCCGSLMLNVRKSGQSSWLQQKFYIINVPGPAILGLPTCELLGLVKLNVDAIKRKMPDLSTQQPDTEPKGAYQAAPPGTKINTIDGLKYWYPDCFDGIRSFKGEATLHLKANAEPFINPPHRCPIHLRDKIKAELDNMEQKGIIRKVDTHTDWHLSLTYAIKQDGSLRVCLDPQKLNKSLK